METYDRVAKVVGPKKEALAVAEAEYAQAPTGRRLGGGGVGRQGGSRG